MKSPTRLASSALAGRSDRAADPATNQQAESLRRALQARADTLVGGAEIPAGLIPVMEGNADGVRAMRAAGVDYSKLKFRGATAVNIARQSVDRDLVAAVGDNGSDL